MLPNRENQTWINGTIKDFVLHGNSTEGSSQMEEAMNATTIEAESMDNDEIYRTNIYLLILPRITAVISLLAIICVGMEAWNDLRTDSKRSSIVRGNRIRSSTTTSSNVAVITRIQLFYQIPLFCFALAFALGTTPAPKDAIWGTGMIWGAAGNTATCSLQGLMFQFGCVATIGWDAILSTTYLMMVRYKITKFRLQSFEKYYHMIVWPLVLFLSIYPLTQGMYNFNNTLCWLESYPNNCEGNECIRGEGAPMWQNLVSLLSMIHLIFSISIMICLYCSIRGLEDQRQRYTASETASTRQGSTMSDASFKTTSTANRRKNSRAVGIQGILYASGMVITSVPTPAYVVLWNTAGLWSWGFAIFATSLLPLVGYVNFVIFMRGRSVEQCHTCYAKFLRRAHSWIFDYELSCNCLSRCRVDDEEDDAETPSMPPQSRRPSYSRNSGALALRDKKPGALPAIEENGAFECEEGAAGAWTGYFINCKQKEHRPSQWVSELGESMGSDDDSESDYHEHYDSAPSRPARLVSEAERPPTRPERLISEVPDDVENGCYGNGMFLRTTLGHCHLKTLFEDEHDSCTGWSKGSSAPTKPVRCVSEVEALEPGPDQVPELLPYADDLKSECRSAASRKSASTAPSKPERLASEIETPELGECSSTREDSVGSSWQPPTKPERYVSEVELPDSTSYCSIQHEVNSTASSRGPVKPTRYVSEVESTEVGELDDSNNNVATTSVAQNEVNSTASSRAPSRPTRYVSEVELSDVGELDDSDINNVATASMEANSAAFSRPPSKPTRYVSEVEISEVDLDGEEDPSKELGRDGDKVSGAPPVMPVRLASAGLLDISDSGRTSAC